MRALIVDEADLMTTAAQVHFLAILENNRNAAILLTSNEAPSLEPRFRSRVMELHFTSQGLAQAGAVYLVRIAATLGLDIDAKRGLRIMQDAKNNLRSAIMELDRLALMGG
jgi:DNA polymerase III delta prime subunit